MTQEEKAKAYDEAIKRAKKEWSNNLDNAYKNYRERLEIIFPELKESGDEEVRKAIIATIHLYYGEPLEDEAKEMIAWLEKQGERTPPQTNECAWLHLVSDVLTWKDGIGQYLDDPRVQELAKKLCSEYAQKLYNSSVLSNLEKTGKNDTLLDLLNKMPSYITVDGLDYHFVLKKIGVYIAYYECEGEEGRDKIIFWMAGDPVDLLTAMLEKLKEEGLLE